MNDTSLNPCPCGPGCGCEPCNCVDNTPPAEAENPGSECDC